MLIVMLMLAVALFGQFGGQSDLRRTMAAGETDAIFMFPPETVCGSEATDLNWTADGKQLVVTRRVTDLGPQDVPSLFGLKPGVGRSISNRNEILVWDLRTRKARTAFSTTTEGSSLEVMNVVPGTDRVIVGATEVVRDANGVVQGTTSISALLSTSTLSLVRLSTRGDHDDFYDRVLVSPSKPIIAIQRLGVSKGPTTVRFVGLDGRTSPGVTLPYKTAVEFDSAGNPGSVVAGPVVGGKPTFKFHRLNPVTGQEMGVTDYLRRTEVKPDDRVEVESLASVAPASVAKAPAVFLKLKGGKEREAGIVTTDGSRGLLSPGHDAVAYVSQGSAMVRLLASVPRSAYDQSLLAAEKLEAISNGKQIGLALILFASDMDDTYPTQDVDLRSKLEPYTKNPSLMTNFTYTFSGGALTGIEKPAETQIGYVTGPGGRAVIFADGHVKWRPDAP